MDVYKCVVSCKQLRFLMAIKHRINIDGINASYFGHSNFRAIHYFVKYKAYFIYPVAIDDDGSYVRGISFIELLEYISKDKYHG